MPPMEFKSIFSSAPNRKLRWKIDLLYRVTLVVWDMGWLDSDLPKSIRCWAATVATYSPSISNPSQPNLFS